MGSVGSNSTATPQGLTTPVSVLFPMTLPNTEYARAFPNKTQYFRLINDGPYICKLSYQDGESGSNYVPIYPGDSHEVFGIVAVSVTLYLQSPGPINLHIESWS